jgi:predicted  nucleic acid-binding Zn-ribbon protein
LLLFYFFLIFIATCLYLILSGKLKKWSGAATSTKKSRIEASKYEIEKRNIEHEKKNVLTNLGKKAWDSRIQHDNYASNFTELEFLDRQQIELPKKINSLEEQLNQFRFDRTSFLDTFKTKQIDLESKSKQLNDFVIQSEVRLHEINKRLSVIDQEHTEIRENEFNSSLLESEKLKNEKLDLEKQISSAQKEINTINDQINQIYDEKKSTISAIDEKIKKFVEESRKTRGELSGIRHKTPYLISSLGSLVNMTRPNNEILYPFYQELDTIETKLSSISSEYDLIKTQLDISDKNYKRNFYLSIFGLILILSVIILLIVYLL